MKTDKQPSGFKGWLILPLIGTIVSFLIITYSAFSVLLLAREGGMIYLIASILLLGYSAFLLGLIFITFKKKKSAIKYQKASLIINLIITYITALEYATIIIQLISAVIWFAYWQTSKRVKNTFVN